jgi:hypothetical protein
MIKPIDRIGSLGIIQITTALLLEPVGSMPRECSASGTASQTTPISITIKVAMVYCWERHVDVWMCDTEIGRGGSIGIG